VSNAFCRTATTTVHAVGLESAALATHLLLYPTGLCPEPLPPAHPDCGHASGHAPVLLLHGLFDNRSVFTLLRHSLRSHGWAHVHAINYNPTAADLHAAAVLLGRHVVHARRVYGGEQVAIVGHSLGGLVARYYVQLLGGHEHVHSVVTLGTPHAGTLSALPLYPIPIARQLLPGSPVFEALGAPAPLCGTRFLAFWGDRDPVILPPGNALLRHPDLRLANVRVPGAGHLSLPVHPQVLARLRRFLAAAPAPSDLPRNATRQRLSA
jgi:pimeloyl-ACP methyl ester carboxylesterase